MLVLGETLCVCFAPPAQYLVTVYMHRDSVERLVTAPLLREDMPIMTFDECVDDQVEYIEVRVWVSEESTDRSVGEESDGSSAVTLERSQAHETTLIT